MLRCVALVRTDVSEELSAFFIRVTRIGELGTTLAVTSNRRTLRVTASVVPSSPILVTLMKEPLSSSETSVLTRATGRKIPEDDNLHSHRRENLKSYIVYLSFSLSSTQSRRFVCIDTFFLTSARAAESCQLHAQAVLLQRSKRQILCRVLRGRHNGSPRPLFPVF
jgi:hypothetical protein